MSTRSLVMPDLLPGLDLFPTIDFNASNYQAARAMIAQTPAPELPADVEVSSVSVTSFDGATIRIVIHQSKSKSQRARPAILHMHGGGYIFGAPEMNSPLNCRLVQEFGCVVVSVDYRLAPEAKFPTPVEDCYAALGWLHANATALNIDPSRIVIKGESAGGGLAAALALLARDRGQVPIAFQLLVYPMIDDRQPRTKTTHTGEFIWTAASNAFGWSSLLGDAAGGSDVSPYAAAARATNLDGMPPTFICVGALDLFLEENIDFAQRLLKADVPTELHVYPGAYHGFDIVHEARTTKRFTSDCFEALSVVFA